MFTMPIFYKNVIVYKFQTAFVILHVSNGGCRCNQLERGARAGRRRKQLFADQEQFQDQVTTKWSALVINRSNNKFFLQR